MYAIGLLLMIALLTADFVRRNTVWKETVLRTANKPGSHPDASFPVCGMKAHEAGNERRVEVVITRRFTVAVGTKFLSETNRDISTYLAVA